jgi:hypothetical protein
VNESQENVATTIADCFSECLNAAAMIASARVWRAQCAAMTAEARKQTIAQALSRVAAVLPLLDLPNVVGPKDELRRAAAVAVELERATTAWDAVTEPPPPLVALAWDLLACLGVPEGYEFQVPDDPPQG